MLVGYEHATSGDADDSRPEESAGDLHPTSLSRWLDDSINVLVFSE